MKKLAKWLYWPLTFLGALILSYVVSYFSANYLSDHGSSVLGIALFIIVMIIILKSAWKAIPADEVWVTTLYGAKYRELSSGPTLLLPLGLEKIASECYTGQQMMKIYLDSTVKHEEVEENAFVFGDADFKDCSNAGVVINYFFKINDYDKATFNVENLFNSIAEKVASISTDNFLEYEIADAKKNKSKLTKENLACAKNITDPAYLAPTQDEYENSEFYFMMTSFGVLPIDLDVADFRIPSEVADQIQKQLVAENEKRVREIQFEGVKVENKTMAARAEGKKKEMLILANAEKEALKLKGEGEASKITSIIAAAKIPVNQTAAYLSEREKWNAISQSKATDKVILVEGNSQIANGVGFGAGTHTTNPPQLQRPQRGS